MSGSPHAVFFGVYGAGFGDWAATVADRQTAASEISTSRFIKKPPGIRPQVYKLWPRTVVPGQLVVTFFDRFLPRGDRLALLAACRGFHLAFDVDVAGG